MSLLDDIKREQSGRVNTCGVAMMFHNLPDGLKREEIESVMADPTISSAAITRALRKRGVPISEYSISRHRRGGCICGT